MLIIFVFDELLFFLQWECKADMDNAYRFGKVQVSCEGYDSPYDPYVLKGSCGVCKRAVFHNDQYAL